MRNAPIWLALAFAACGPGKTAAPGYPETANETAIDLAPVLTAGCDAVTVEIPSLASDGGALPDRIRIERSTDGNTWTTVADVAGTMAVHGVTLQQQPQQRLGFRFFASSGGLEAGPSPVANVVPLSTPDAPTEVTALPGSARATVAWQLPASDHGSPFTLQVLADLATVGNVYQFPAGAGATRAVVGDLAHPLSVDVSPFVEIWSFRVSATNACGTSISDRSNHGIHTPPWNRTPDADLALGTTLAAMGAAQIAGTEYLVGGIVGRPVDRRLAAAGAADRCRGVRAPQFSLRRRGARPGSRQSQRGGADQRRAGDADQPGRNASTRYLLLHS